MRSILSFVLIPPALFLTGCLVVTVPAPTPEKPRLPDATLEPQPNQGTGIVVIGDNNGIIVGGTSVSRTGQTVGVGEVVSQSRKLGSFMRISCTGTLDIEVVCGKAQSVTVTAQANLQSLIRTEVRGDTLTITEEGSLYTDKPLRVKVTCPTLDTISSRGTGSVIVSQLKAESLSVDLSGTGTITLSGTTETADLQLSGTGELDAEDLQAHEATAQCSGTGSLLVWASQRLDARVSGTGSILYKGKPEQLREQISGLGAIRQR